MTHFGFGMQRSSPKQSRHSAMRRDETNGRSGRRSTDDTVSIVSTLRRRRNQATHSNQRRRHSPEVSSPIRNSASLDGWHLGRSNGSHADGCPPKCHPFRTLSFTKGLPMGPQPRTLGSSRAPPLRCLLPRSTLFSTTQPTASLGNGRIQQALASKSSLCIAKSRELTPEPRSFLAAAAGEKSPGKLRHQSSPSSPRTRLRRNRSRLAPNNLPAFHFSSQKRSDIKIINMNWPGRW